MDDLLTSIAAKKKRLDELRTLDPRALDNLEHYYDIELTYTSNAIEGNTLSPVETTLVIEKGITVTGKPLKDHLEALDHYDTIRYVRELARHETPIMEGDIRNLHKLVMQRSAPEIAGRYAVSFAPKAGVTRFHHRLRSPRSWGISRSRLRPRRIRRIPHSTPIAVWLTFILLMTVTGGPRGF
jgi:Fic family protein